MKHSPPVFDFCGVHGRDAYTHCGNQLCCYGPQGSRVGAPKAKPARKKSFQKKGVSQ
jgi:hypothetical protein